MSAKKLSKKELDDLRKKEDEVATAEVFKDFVASFDDNPTIGKTFVRGNIIDPDTKSEATSHGPKIYRPTSKLQELAQSFQSTKKLKEERDRDKDKSDRDRAKKKGEKPKSNLEIFKEELRRVQEEREERHRLKKELKEKMLSGEDPDPMLESLLAKPDPMDEFDKSLGYGSHDNGDPQTTNLYLGNLNPKMTEKELCEIFGKFGPLASIKIMWPRSEEEAQRGRNCGFVAFMLRKDGERALETLQGKEVMSFEMKMGWGKAVPIPPQPVYIPPAMLEMTLPPPPSGLPFNAQAHPRDKQLLPPPGKQPTLETLEEQRQWDKLLSNAVVKVVIPTERSMLSLIHRMVEFVVREGPMFEAMIMNKELNNPMFRFLFENQSPAHVYYRWKTFSVLQGDTPNKWRADEFRMFKNGSIWRPPPMNPYLQGMPEPVETPDKESQKKGQLSNSQRDRLEDMLRGLTPDRVKVADTMIFCLEHSEAAEEVVECIAESLSILQTPLPKKIARLYLVSDILYNSSAKIPNASFYRRNFETRLPGIFRDVHTTYSNISGRLRAEQFKQRVMQCFRAWEDWALYPSAFLIKLQNIFLGLVAPPEAPAEVAKPRTDVELDGMPLEADVDGVSVDGVDGAPMEGNNGDDVDGVPMPMRDDEDIDGIPLSVEPPKPKLIKSKWEEVDPTQLEAQAVTTSKWELVKAVESKSKWEQSEDERDRQGKEVSKEERVSEEEAGSQDSSPRPHEVTPYSLVPYKVSKEKEELNEERRQKLREIELKVIKYQDELEAGKRSRKSGIPFAEQVQHYRKKLLNKEKEKQDEKDREAEIERRIEKDREKVDEWERARERERKRERRRSPVERSAAGSRRVVDSSRSDSRSPTPSSKRRSKGARSASRSPPAAYKEQTDSPPLSRRGRSRSRSPRRSQRPSRSPKQSKRSRSGSRSPRHRSHKKKTKR
ncbi:PREDICTED: U2 snRNP-associated SURP motif-containing protein-like [Priapulus caudatus]|uniref:U2 snRNP-associated SURP motif-containing protein-like n=1 Tax=Priapulus caudatus TaxID=37621 RepID=A0ABM1FB12_PRICU|nr:PREDICTED: U2 snRNP-associated SURP motif-containing protein-like [Priapulus caudatus]XP_014681633.1 PREDICTED: U2 snRNP-associated SURP motif-containing protein-like [Priapulus caudatus]